MTRSSSTELAKPKRKAIRSVSSLTPSQLARKRANDREVQRAIRARTKEHIERLERGIKDLKSKQSSDHTVQELLRRNKALQEELMRLKMNTGVLMTLSPYSASVYDGNLSAGSDAIPTGESPFSGDYNSLPDYSQQYVTLLNNCGSRASTVICSAPFNVSNPSSSSNDYSAAYIPTSVPTSTLRSNNTSSSRIRAVCHKDVVKMEYDDVDHHDTIPQGLLLPDVRPNEEASHTQYLDAGFRLSNPPLQPGTPHAHPYMSHRQQQQCTWNMYPMYYLQVQSSVHCTLAPAAQTGMRSV